MVARWSVLLPHSNKMLGLIFSWYGSCLVSVRVSEDVPLTVQKHVTARVDKTIHHSAGFQVDVRKVTCQEACKRRKKIFLKNISINFRPVCCNSEFCKRYTNTHSRSTFILNRCRLIYLIPFYIFHPEFVKQTGISLA